MNSRSGLLLTISLLALAAGPQVVLADTDLKEIMQGLRDDVTALVDGLLTDDFDGVAQAAKKIAAHPGIPAEQVQLVAAELGQEMTTFKQFDTSVHDLSLSIAEAAEAKDREQLISDYQNMLANCLACHAAYRDRVSAALAAR